MLNNEDNKVEEEREEGQRRGQKPLPPKDACPKGHVDWETVKDRKGNLIKRCRLCGAVDKTFKGKVVK